MIYTSAPSVWGHERVILLSALLRVARTPVTRFCVFGVEEAGFLGDIEFRLPGDLGVNSGGLDVSAVCGAQPSALFRLSPFDWFLRPGDVGVETLLRFLHGSCS